MSTAVTLDHAAEVARRYYKSIDRDFDAESPAIQAGVARHALSVARSVAVDGAQRENLTESERAYWAAWEAELAERNLRLVSKYDGNDYVPALAPPSDSPALAVEVVNPEGPKKAKGK